MTDFLYEFISVIEKVENEDLKSLHESPLLDQILTLKEEESLVKGLTNFKLVTLAIIISYNKKIVNKYNSLDSGTSMAEAMAIYHIKNTGTEKVAEQKIKSFIDTFDDYKNTLDSGKYLPDIEIEQNSKKEFYYLLEMRLSNHFLERMKKNFDLDIENEEKRLLILDISIQMFDSMFHAVKYDLKKIILK